MKRALLATFISIFFASQAAAQTSVFPTVRTIDSSPSTGYYTSAGADSAGHLAVSYQSIATGDLYVWLDDGRGSGVADDRIANGTEIRTIDSGGVVGSYSSITTDVNGRLAVSYYDGTNGALKLWLDDGRGGGTAGDGDANGTELRFIEPSGTVGSFSSIGLDGNGRLAISYLDGANNDLKLWIDDGRGSGTAGDGLANGTEIRTVDTTGDVGYHSSVAADGNGRIAVAYHDFTNLQPKLFLDDGAGGGTAGDGVPNGSEIRVIDSSGFMGTHIAIAADANGRLAVIYLASIAQDLKLWLDDGRGGGTAGDGNTNGTEIRTIDSTNNVGSYGSIVLDQDGYLAASFYDSTNGALRFWHDDGAGGGTAGDGLANGAELQTLDDGTLLGFYTSATLDGHGRLAVSYQDVTNGLLKLAYLEQVAPRTIDTSGDVGQDSSITTDVNGRLAVSYYEGGLTRNLRLWIDDGESGGIAGNGIRDGGELRTIDSPGNVGSSTAITKDGNNRLAIVYLDASNSNPKLWLDDGAGGGTAGDGIENGTERRTIDVTSGLQGDYTAITTDDNNRLAVAYTDSTNGFVMLWLDDGAGGGTPGDGNTNGSEIRTIDGSGDGMQDVSIAKDGSGRLAISYQNSSSGAFMLWRDDGRGGGTASDNAANGTEIRTIDASTSSTGLTSSLTTDANGRLAASYFDFDNFYLMLWVDDGRGGGTADDGLASGTEIRTIDGTGNGGEHTSIALDQSGRFVVSYFDETNDDLKIWADDGSGGGTAGDGVANGTETRTVDSANSTGLDTAITRDVNGSIAVSYYYQSTSDLKVFTFTPYGVINVVGNGSGIANGDTNPSTVTDTDFEGAAVSGGLVAKTYTVQDVGQSLLHLGRGAVSISGMNAADFSVSDQADETVAAGDETAFSILFNPSAAGTRTATITVRNNDVGASPYTFAIQGTGTAPEIGVTGNSVSIADGDASPSTTDDTDFGSVVSGMSATKTFTIANSGADPLSLVGAPRVTLSGSSAFSVSAQPAASVAASASTTFTIQFSPASAGAQTATVSIDNDDADEAPYNFSIQGAGLSAVDTDGDGTVDAIDSDDDNDSVSDTQEATDGTDPLDRGSYLQILSTVFCSEWNGFLGMININEYYNATGSSRNLNVTMYNSNGIAQSSSGASVLPGSQFDVLMHDLPGFVRDSYGRACTDVPGGAAGDIDGRTIFYHPRGSGYDFAIALPFTTGATRSQFVQFNSYDPSLSSSNPTTNWVTVVNEEQTTELGTLYYYAQDGSTLGSEVVSLAGGARRDFAAHQFGFNRIGLVEWRPATSTARFVLRNIRYYYDNSVGANTFHSAIQLEGRPGNGEPMVLVLDKRNGTAVLELSNGTGSGITVDATFRSDTGVLVGTQQYSIGAYSTTHAIADEFMPTDVGSVTLDGSAASSVVATTIHYTRDAALDLKSAYAMHPRESLGSALRGSYNSYLGQSCDLILANTTGSAVTSSVTLTRNDGTVVANALPVNTAANGVTVYDLCALDPVNSYGAVVVVPSVPDSISGTVVRNGSSSSYQFATQLRQ